MAAKRHPEGRRPAQGRARAQRGGGQRPRRPDPRVRQNVPVERIANPVAVATAPALAVLGRMPKLLLPAIVAVALVGGLIAGGPIGLACLAFVVGLLGWLLAAFWPMLPPTGRVLRVAALAAVLAVGVLQL